MGTLNSVQERLDYLIKIKKMSENAFMKATGTNNIGKMRSGKLSISEGTISKICNSLGVSYSWLKYGSGSMNGNMVIQLGETHQKIEESINEAFKHGIPMAQLINAGNVGDNSQNLTTGTERAKEREEESFKDKNAQLIQIINAQNETIKSKDSTKEIFLRTRKRIESFDEHADFDNIDRDWLERFQAHELLKGRMSGGIAIDLRNIRTVFNWAIDNEITTKYPFRKFSIKTERQQYLYLSAEEMREYRDFPVEPFMEKYRDLFMLGFYLIGINLSDLLELPADCIKKGRIQYKRNKTGRLYDIKVEPEAMEIIRKYKGKKHLLCILDDGAKESSFRRTLGDYLKRIGPTEMKKNKRGALIKKEIKPLHKDIVWYTARRSWATIAASIDIPKEVIGKALGHSEWDSSTTDLYIQFDNKKIDEANRKVIDYLNG